MHGACSVVVYILQLVIESASARHVRIAVAGSGYGIALGRDERIIDLLVFAILCLCPVKVKAGIADLRNCFPCQNNAAIFARLSAEVSQGNGRWGARWRRRWRR